jgi:hypothetical protein
MYVKPMENILPLSPGLGQGKLTIRWDEKIEKFDTKTKFKKQTNGSIRGKNLRSIEWYQKTYVQISGEFSFKVIMLQTFLWECPFSM